MKSLTDLSRGEIPPCTQNICLSTSLDHLKLVNIRLYYQIKKEIDKEFLEKTLDLQLKLESEMQKNHQIEKQYEELQQNYNSLEENYEILNNQMAQLNFELKSKEQELNDSKMYLDHINDLLKDSQEQCTTLTDHINVLQKKIDSIENYKVSYYDIIKYFETEKTPPGATELGWRFLKEIFVNMHKNGKSARKHSPEMKLFSFLIYNYSPGAYRTLKAHFPFPAYNTFINETKTEEENIMSFLLNKSKIPEYCMHHFERFNDSNLTKHRVTLAIDAIAIQPIFLPSYKAEFGSIKIKAAINSQQRFTIEHMKNEKHREEFEKALKANPNSPEASNAVVNNAFIYYLEPLDPSIPCLPVQVYLKKGGSANSVINELTAEIIKLLESTNIIDIVCITTDGDPGHNSLYDETYNELLKLSKSLNIDEILANEKRFLLKHPAATDLLHLFKTMRVKFLLNDIDLFPGLENSTISHEELIKQLKPGMELTDLTQIGKMRDVYAINFFTFENLNRLIQDKNYNGALLFTPFVCWARAVFDSILTLEARILLLKAAYEIILRMHNTVLGIEAVHWNGTKQKNYKRKANALTVATDSVFRKMITTLYVLISELSDWNDVKIIQGWRYKNFTKMFQLQNMKDLGIERLGTHPLENFNGYIREQSCSKDSLQTIHQVCAKSQMMKTIAVRLEIGTAKRNRANAGGLKVSEFRNMYSIDEKHFKPSTFANSFFLLCNIFSKFVIFGDDIDQDQMNYFFEWLMQANSLSKLEFVQRIRLNVPSKASNSKIQSRNISYIA